ncbi:synaptotagmin-17-like isoform X2 [Apostichopus japonicus]
MLLWRSCPTQHLKHVCCCLCPEKCFKKKSESLESLADTERELDSSSSDEPTPLNDSGSFSRQPSTSSRRSSCSESRRSSTPCSDHSFGYRRSSSCTSSVPVIDMKPIEFWPPNTNQETVQPKNLTRRYTPDGGSHDHKLQPKLYDVTESDPVLTDEEKLALYKLGKIHYALKYNVDDQTLTVRIIKAIDLPPPVFYDESRQDMAHSNPYVKICLLPDQKESRQTTVKRKTQQPEFEEQFVFHVPFQEAERRMLYLSVQDFDKFSRHCVIGQHTETLSGLNLIKGGHYWKPLLPTTQSFPGRGELLLSLNYLPSAGRLNCDVIKARQLLQTDIVAGSDPYVRTQLVIDEKVMKTKKTTTKKNTLDPVFNESFSFNVAPSSLKSVSVIASVWDYNSKGKDNFVGQVIMGKHLSGSSEVTHWTRMLESQRSPVAQWHTIKTREECDKVYASLKPNS